MAQFTAAQIAQTAANAGFKGNQIVMATAIALAESGGNTAAIGYDNDGSHDVGLWQINSIHGYSDAAMQDPAQNAAAAYSISSSGTNWSPWSTFGTGAYLKYMATAMSVSNVKPGSAVDTKITIPAIPIIPGSPIPIPGTGGTSLNPLSSVMQTINDLTNAFNTIVKTVQFLTNVGMWERILIGVGGVALMAFGFDKLAQGTPIGTVTHGIVKTGTDAVGLAAVA